MVANGLRPSVASPAAKVTPCCSAMPTSKQRSGKFLGEQVETGARRHRGGDGDDLVVLLRLLDQRVGVDLGVGRRRRLRLRLRAGRDVELDDAVILVGGFLGRLVALALLRDDVDQERPVLGVAHVVEHRQQVIDVVAVDRADIEEAELVEQRAAGDESAGIFLHRHRALLEEGRQQLGQLLHGMVHGAVGRDRRPGAPDSPTARRPAARSTCRCR